MENNQLPTVFFNLRVYEAITEINARKINSSWDSVANECAIWLKCTALHSESGNSVNYTWTIGNETHTGATFRYFTTEGEDTGKCTASNPVSEKSASIQVECRNSTQAGGFEYFHIEEKGKNRIKPELNSLTDPSTPIPKIWIYISTVLGVLVLILVLVCLRRRKAAPEAMDTVYSCIENVERKEAASQDELSPGPLYELVQNVEARPPQQEVQQRRLMDPPS
ncbi:uncharacterized protein LOC115529319 isoform X3 [Gadus morhua]|uniref:uncharacterized protein LOC115529319 isoform X3 n=1 Tax=Gadus morhua TaxID=8049 RepID=UPI0011B49483|nr:uncharacterized protein LOC115529319 isoform X3 [Gadus morhua]